MAWYVNLWSAPGAPLFHFEGRTDSTGTFHLAAPPGRYTLRFSGPGHAFYYAATGPTDDAGQADTLQLAAGQSIGPIELRLGSCEIRVHLPSTVNGRRVYIGLKHPGRDRTVVAATPGEGGWFAAGFPAIVPGTYIASASVLGSELGALPIGASEETAERIQVSAGSRAQAEFEIPAPAVLSGSIDGSFRYLQDLEASHEAILAAYRPDSTRVDFADWSDSRTWSLATYEAAPLRLHLRLGGVERWIGGAGFREATLFTPVWGETLAVPEEVESGILLRVTGSESLTGMSGTVELYDSLGVALGSTGGTIWYGENRFAFANLIPGAYYLRLHHWGYSRQFNWSGCWFERAGDQAHATPIHIRTRGELLTLEFRPPPAARIRGHLQTAYPREYESLRPTLWKEGDTGDELYREWLASPADPFEFSGMELGRYLLSVTILRGGVSAEWWYPGSWRSADAQPIDIHDFGQVEELNWSLPL